jgi:hypothetical protein
MLQSIANAQTTPEVPTEKAPKPKKPKNPTAAVTPETGQAKAAMPSESEIQAAKASGQVWVNTETGIYHKSGKWFGATKHGKFMSEPDAVKAGYRAAKNEK